MDSQDYLDQISRSARPVKPSGNGLMGILTSKYFKWGMIALAALIVIMIFGSILGVKKPGVEDHCIALKLRLDNTIELMNEFQPSIKSSKLRSLSASLRGIFTNTSSQMTNAMIRIYEFEEGDISEDVIAEADTTKDGLYNDLFEAKINGLLDRVYAHKMALEIYNAMSDESNIIETANDEDLKSILTSSRDSLNNLYNQFNDFSETK